MPGRRSNTGAQPTPLEETEPTAPPAPAPEPVPVEDPPAEPEDDLRSYDPDGSGPPNVVEEVEPSPPSVQELDAAFQEAMRKAGKGNPLGLFGWTGFPRAAVSAAAEEGEYPLTVHEAIAEVTRQVSHIAKDRRTEGGERYNFRGIDDVLAALHPVLGDVGLVILPGRMVEHRRETRATAKGGTLNVALVRVRYTMVGPDGTKLRGEAWGEAGDSGDKATQKALSQAYKTFALQTFSIPTEASAADDPDLTNEPGRPFTTEEQERAGNAWEAALNATTLEALVGVRRRAEHLLDVPVLMADGSLHPLRLLFDSRRLALEGVTQ